MARMQRSLFAQLNALAEEISHGAVKSAETKKADNPTPADPGNYSSASTHPSAHVDNDVQKATTGARAAEYEADIKKQQGALAVDNTPEMSQEGRQDEVQVNIGTNVAATGEDPAAEHDYKSDKDDPGTSHPAKASDGEKYSAVSFKEAFSKCASLSNEILARLLSESAEKAAEMPAFLKEKADAKKDEPAKDEEKGELKGDQHKLDVDDDGKIEGSDLAALREGKEAAFKAGYELAAALGMSKEAAEASVREVCANTLREADEMADLVLGLFAAKAAAAEMADEATEGEDHSAPADVGSGANDAAASPEAAGLEGMMGGEEAMPADAAAGAGAPSEDEAVQELAMALEELGIPPEALIQAMHSEGGEGGEGAMAPEAAPKMASADDLSAIGQAVVNFKRSGKFQVKEARTKRSRQLRDIMKQHVLELVNR